MVTILYRTLAIYLPHSLPLLLAGIIIIKLCVLEQ